MKTRNYFFICFFIIASGLVKAQEAVLCALQNDYIKIESTADIPAVTNNPDGTVTLTLLDQNITYIFAQHIIYDFYQAYPNANRDGELIKYYTIVHGNRALINKLYNTSGQQIVQTKTFEENTLDISTFSSGLYFIRLSTLNNQQKIFKFLKN